MKDWDLKTRFKRWIERLKPKPTRSEPAPKRHWYVRSTPYPSVHRVDTYAAKQRRQARKRHSKPTIQYRRVV